MASKKSASGSTAVEEQKTPVETEQLTEEANSFPIETRIEKLFDDDNKKLKAIASCKIGDFAVHGIRIFENERGMFVNMPSNSYTDAHGKTQYEDIFHPCTKEAREKLIANIMGEYNNALAQAQTQNAELNNNNSSVQAQQA